MKYYRIWFLRFIIVLALLEILTAAFNYLIDPLWCFGTTNRFNSTAVVIDQRQQKTNKLTFGPDTYDAILLGSSRSEPIPADAFSGERVFNYSVPAIFPDEYLPYLRYAREKRASQLKRIYLGLDFFGSNHNKVVNNPSPESYFDQADKKSYRLAALLSLGPFRAWLKRLFERDYYYRYDRIRSILIPREMDRGEVEKFTRMRLAVFREKFYQSEKYSYNLKLPSLYSQIKGEFPGALVIPYTSPVSLPLLKVLVEEGRYADYEQWLKDIVAAFGGVYHFMDANSVTKRSENFYDADHLHPQAAELIARRISGTRDIPQSDFGTYITADNLDACLAKMRLRHSRLFGTMEYN